MKLKNIFGVVLATGVLAVSASSVYAATDSFTLGTPIDLATNESASTLTVDSVIAIPVDITTTTDNITAYSAVVKYDADVLAPSVTQSSLSGDQKTNLKALANGSNSNIKLHGTTIGAVQGFVYDNSWEEDAVAGTLMVNVDYASDTEADAKCVSAGWMTDGSAYGTNPTKPEFYLIFKVVGESSSDALNVRIAEVIEAESMVADTDHDKASTSDIPAETEVKTNACAGAFKITIDGEAVPKYVHALYVSFDGGEKQAIDQYVTADDKVFDFPVRVSSTKGGSVEAELFADLGETADEANELAVKIGTVTVDLSGTATEYATATTSIE